jgi:hypothetical protein
LSALLLAGLLAWLKISHGTEFLGVVPTLTIWIAPLFAGLWLVLWHVPIASRLRWILIACTAAAAVSILTLTLARALGVG